MLLPATNLALAHAAKGAKTTKSGYAERAILEAIARTATEDVLLSLEANNLSPRGKQLVADQDHKSEMETSSKLSN